MFKYMYTINLLPITLKTDLLETLVYTSIKQDKQLKSKIHVPISNTGALLISVYRNYVSSKIKLDCSIYSFK